MEIAFLTGACRAPWPMLAVATLDASAVMGIRAGVGGDAAGGWKNVNERGERGG